MVRRRNNSLSAAVTVLLTAALVGCEQEVPSSEYGRIMLSVRPETIDRSLIEIFSIRIGDTDPLEQHLTVTNGSELRFSWTLKPKEGILKEGEHLELRLGRRLIVDGRADWALDESQESVQRLVSNEWGLGIKDTIDENLTINADPGEYELRFYAIRNMVDRVNDYLPRIYLIGEGRMTVLPAENPSGSGEPESATD